MSKPTVIGMQFEIDIEALNKLPQEERDLIVAQFMHKTAVEVESAIQLELTSWRAMNS